MTLIPPHFINSVVSLGVETKPESGDPKFVSTATGFLVGKQTGESNDKGPLYRLFLVTNHHVFYDNKSKGNLKDISLRFNTTDNKSHLFTVNLLGAEGNPLWSTHPKKYDLAVLPINANAINEAKISYYFFTEDVIFYAKDFPAKNISTGDGLFVLGFPMSISGKAKNFVIVRLGIIARVDEEVLDDGYFYIDASAFPGNSGGPVIVKPEIVSIQGTQSNQSAGLIGVISSGETYSDVAVSQQTGAPKIVFTEQTGLVRVVPMEYVYDIIDGLMKSSAPVAKIQESGSV